MNVKWTGVMNMMKVAMENTKVRNVLLLLYVLAILGFSASARADVSFSFFPVMKTSNITAQAKTLVGEVAMTFDGRVYLVVSDEVFYELRHESEDLSSFNGLRVQVEGYELMHRVGPVFQLASFGPLLNEEEAESIPAPVLVVLQISEISE